MLIRIKVACMCIAMIISTPAITNQNVAGTFTPILSFLLFPEEFQLPALTLNDTGITWGGEYSSGNNLNCLDNTTITSPQDCDHGRDASNNNNSDGHAGFSFTKLDADGNPLEVQSVDYATTPWSCVKDNVTGLVWEVKQNKDGEENAENIHDADNKYRWGGKTQLGTGSKPYYDDWDALVDGSNGASFCGFSSDWRVPTVNELENLVSFDRTAPSIDTVYFPNTYAAFFWSASPYAYDSGSAWGVSFFSGFPDDNGRGYGEYVRLVRSGH